MQGEINVQISQVAAMSLNELFAPDEHAARSAARVIVKRTSVWARRAERFGEGVAFHQVVEDNGRILQRPTQLGKVQSRAD